MNKNFKIIAETAFSHEGNFNYLMSQIKEAKKGQADFIKFQVLIDKEGLCTKNHDNFKNINSWIINKDKWLEALLFAKSQYLKTIVLPLTLNSLEFLKKHEQKIDAEREWGPPRDTLFMLRDWKFHHTHNCFFLRCGKGCGFSLLFKLFNFLF